MADAISTDPNEANAARQELADLFTAMQLEVSVTVAADDGERVLLEVQGDDTSFVIGKKGTTLDALQYVLNRIAAQKKLLERAIHVDAAGFRERKADQLTELAQKLAEQARRTKRPVRAEPMPPHDRRIVHLALANETDLETRSEGEEPMRRVVVVLR